MNQSVVTLNGKVSATYSIRAQITSAGQIYMAGMGVGVEQQPDGSYQSQILMQADRFALINVVNGVVTSPFVIQGGQTFINQALIGTGWITNAMIGNQIASSSVAGSGLPRWEINKDGGRVVRGDNFTINEHPAYGYRMTDNQTGVTFIEIGELS